MIYSNSVRNAVSRIFLRKNEIVNIIHSIPMYSGRNISMIIHPLDVNIPRQIKNKSNNPVAQQKYFVPNVI